MVHHRNLPVLFLKIYLVDTIFIDPKIPVAKTTYDLHGVFYGKRNLFWQKSTC
jgi:hypothetical protein